MKLTPQQIKVRLDKLKAERTLWENHWQELADFCQPRKREITNKFSPGDKRNTHLFDSTAQMSSELLAGALYAMLTNPHAIWFSLTTGDEDLDKSDDVRRWLQAVARDMHNVLNNSNFQTEIHELYLDLVIFGTATMLIEEDDDTIVKFSTRHIAEIYITENHKGFIDEVYRVFKWTPRQIIQEFGEEKAGEKVNKLWKEQSGDKLDIIHAVFIDDITAKQKGFKFRSQYIIHQFDHELRDRGFRDFPYVVPRWTKASGETYGRSPAMNALPDVKMVNKMEETLIKAVQKAVDPPLQLPHDSYILPIITRPGGLNFRVSGPGTQDRIEPVFNDARIDVGFQAGEARRARIREAFFIDQLQLSQGPQMTATEVNKRTEEKMRFLGPMAGRQQAELLRPLIDKIFDVMDRKKMIKPAPAVLAERKNVEVKYSSFIAKAQKASEINDLTRGIETIAPIAQTDPTSLDILNAEEAIRFIMKNLDLPQQLIRSKEEIEDIRQRRAQAQQQAIAQEQQDKQAENAAKIAPLVAQGG